MRKICIIVLLVLNVVGFCACEDTIKTTNSAKSYIGTNYEIVVAELEAAGFENVIMDEVFDLDPAVTDAGYKNKVMIGWETVFEKGEEIPFDTKISVICRKPYQKYKVSLHIDFVPNLFFNKYDVKLQIDGVEDVLLEHGEDVDLEFSLKKGTYEFVFVSEESSSTKGEIVVEVNNDMEASMQLIGYSDKISVEAEYMTTNEVMCIKRT